MNFKTIEELHHIVFQPTEVLENMNDWCKKTHGASGLSAAVPKGTPLAEVEQKLLAMITKHFNEKERVILTGNSIGNDRRFIDRYMPLVANRLHYRMIDVSSFKEVFREKYNISVKKTDCHRALDDIHESIHELQHYLSFVNIPKSTEAPHA
jgi:oligoribonuclease